MRKAKLSSITARAGTGRPKLGATFGRCFTSGRYSWAKKRTAGPVALNWARYLQPWKWGAGDRRAVGPLVAAQHGHHRQAGAGDGGGGLVLDAQGLAADHGLAAADHLRGEAQPAGLPGQLLAEGGG